MENSISLVILIVLINLIGFLLAYYRQTDKLTDLCYNLSFLSGAVMMYISTEFSLYHTVLLLMVSIWAIRLGVYLFIRVCSVGKDERFDSFRSSFTGFMKFWILQTVSILLLFIPVYSGFNVVEGDMSFTSFAGIMLWLIGFVLESVADYQKYKFKNNPKNKRIFFREGLYKIVRYPNYLGEILIWWGIWLYVLPFYKAWTWISIVSPIWITVLLVFISGIPLLELQSKKKYGNLPEYKEYISKTKRLLPGIY